MKILKSLIYSKWMASRLLIPLLRIDNKLRTIITRYSIIENGGIHPKHRIIEYKEWFLDKIRSNDVVLDVGCNVGLLPEKMSTKAKKVYGIEILEAHVKKAKATINKPNLVFLYGDATTYDYSDCEPIDCITLSNVLEHIEHRQAFLKKLIHAVPWKMGDTKRFLIRVPMIDRDWLSVYKKELGVEYRLDLTHFTEYTQKQFEQEINESGLRIVSITIRFGELFAEVVESKS